jgi:hypothetical protein
LPLVIETGTFRQARLFYDKLEKDYRTYHLDSYVRKMPVLKQIIKEQENRSMAEEAIRYYLEKQQWETAFEYLDILKEFGVPAKETKSYQKPLGAGLCSGKAQKKVFITELTKNDSWYKVLRVSCTKN